MVYNYSAPINMLSYGSIGINILDNMDKMGCDVTLFPIGQIEADTKFHPLLQKCINKQANYKIDIPSILVYHQFALHSHIGKGKYIGWPIFELDEFTDREKHHLNNQDHIIVCSSWAKQVCENNNIKPKVSVVPLGVDQTVFTQTYERKDNVTRFITVGKKEFRKSFYELFECFDLAFSQNDNVELIVCWGSVLLDHIDPKESKAWDNMVNSYKLCDKIKIYNWLPSQQHISNLMNKSDCFITLSKAEGFNFGCIEALSLGLPVIATNYSSHTEYLSKDNAMLVDIDEVYPSYDGRWFTSGVGNWAKIGQNQKDQCIEYMRGIHNMKLAGDDLTNKEGILTGQKFTWKNSAEKLLAQLGES